MKRIFLTMALGAAVLATGCKNENTTAEDRVEEDLEATKEGLEEESTELTEVEEVQEVTVELEPTNDSGLEGTAVFTEENGEVTMVAEFSGLEKGGHAIHLHEKGDCSAEDGTSAGGHWNPTDEEHGKWGSEQGFHRGDIGNFDVNADGQGSITFSTDKWCIGCEDEKRDILGKAVIVHQGTDDFTSQPSGAAGKRVGCGVIEK